MKTRIEHIATGAPQSVTVYFEIDEPSTFYPYGYLHRDHIFVFDSNQQPLDFVWNTPTGNTITVTHANGEAFYVQRIVPRDELYVEWEDGAVLHDRNLAAAHLQHLMIIQEIDDGFVFGIEDPDNSLLPAMLRGIRVPDELDSIRPEALLTPDVATRAESFFAWADNGDIWPVPITDLLDLIGGTTATPGRGLELRVEDPLQFFDIANPQNGELHAIKDDTWVRPQAADILYDSTNATNPSATVQDAIALNTVLILALTSGIRVRGTWDATLNDPDILTGAKRTGDLWYVDVAGETALPSHPDAPEYPAPITGWLKGERALWVKTLVSEDPDVYTEGFYKIAIVDTLPADNILVNSDIETLPATSQLAHELHKNTNDIQDTSIATNTSNILLKADKTLAITAGAGLIGGGDLSANRDIAVGAGAGILVTADAIAVAYGTAADTACVGNDTRLSNNRDPNAHNHDAGEITTGVLVEARVPFAAKAATGTPGKVRLNWDSGNGVLDIRTS